MGNPKGSYMLHSINSAVPEPSWLFGCDQTYSSLLVHLAWGLIVTFFQQCREPLNSKHLLLRGRYLQLVTTTLASGRLQNKSWHSPVWSSVASGRLLPWGWEWGHQDMQQPCGFRLCGKSWGVHQQTTSKPTLELSRVL